MSSYTNGVSLLPPCDGSIGYQVFGVSDSLDFALTEWLGMWINANVSTMRVEFLPIDKSEWAAEKKKRLHLLGIPSSEDQLVVVFTETGRFIGGAKEFADLVKRNFGVVCKLSRDVLNDIAKENGRRTARSVFLKHERDEKRKEYERVTMQNRKNLQDVVQSVTIFERTINGLKDVQLFFEKCEVLLDPLVEVLQENMTSLTGQSGTWDENATDVLANVDQGIDINSLGSVSVTAEEVEMWIQQLTTRPRPQSLFGAHLPKAHRLFQIAKNARQLCVEVQNTISSVLVQRSGELPVADIIAKLKQCISLGKEHRDEVKSILREMDEVSSLMMKEKEKYTRTLSQWRIQMTVCED
eukprot:TRINITY_DN4532_c0_g1_i1.p1 TRINITY_DN4532_c0_g1~~TRINITY_DN4532_c0_g1_i1.p1  ORF type:complete len:354 (-),score=104.00 TRINITY_DN4532_c0_g1_i1:283-1344(-)